MKTTKFKTSAKCGGCVAKIGEFLVKWSVLGSMEYRFDKPGQSADNHLCPRGRRGHETGERSRFQDRKNRLMT